MRRTVVVLLLALSSVSACADEPDGPDTPTPPPDDAAVTLSYDFEEGSDGWASEVTDHTAATRPQNVVSRTGVSPPGLDAGSDLFHLAASNPSDDLFLYLFREVTADAGLQGGRTYDASFSVAFASDAPTGCAGIGGPPGEAVYLKVGAAAEQPVPVTSDDRSRLSVDKGGQSQGGDAAVVAGTIDNGIPCEQALESDQPPYAMVTRTGTVEDVTTAEDGSLWLFVGTDSGFEGRTSIYYDRIEVTLTPTDGDAAEAAGDHSGDDPGGDGTDDGIDDGTGHQVDVGAMVFTDCEADRYTVGYPEGWNTNSEDGLLGPCEVFHPGQIDVP